MTELRYKLSHFLANQVPAHIRNDHPVLVDFLEAYYRFLESEDQAGGLLLSSPTWNDIDQTLDLFVPEFRKQFAVDIPTTALMDARRIVKQINEYYEAKGSETATKMFFRFMFNEAVDVSLPGDYILRASDGRWKTTRIIKVDTAQFRDRDIYSLKNSEIGLHYIEFIPNEGRLVRVVKTSCFNVIRQTEPDIYQLEIDLSKSYQFPPLINEVVDIDINFDGVRETIPSMGDYDSHVYLVANGVIYGSLSKQIVGVDRINIRGTNFRVDDSYNIGQTGIQGRYFVLSGVEGYIDDTEGPYVFEDFGNNAIIRISRTTDARGIDQIQLVDTGRRFVAREIVTGGLLSYFSPIDPAEVYVINPLNPGAGADDYASDTQETSPVDTFTIQISPRAPRNLTGTTAEIVFKTGLIYEPPGTYKDSAGFLSDINHLQDNYFYQPYSYVVESSRPKSEWETAFLRSNHPAGFKLFSVLRFADLIQVFPQASDTLQMLGRILTVELLQGTLVIATRMFNPGPDWDNTDFILTTEELSLITDPNDLRVRIRNNIDAGEVQISRISLDVLSTPL